MDLNQEDGPRPTPEEICSYAEQQINLYQNRVALGKEGHRAINLGECEHYLRIWQLISLKQGKNLSEDEQGEVDDAYYTGDFDYMRKNLKKGE